MIFNTVDSHYLKHWQLKVPSFIKEYILDLFSVFLYITTLDDSNYCYLKVNFLGSENLLWDISGLIWTLTWAPFKDWELDC